MGQGHHAPRRSSRRLGDCAELLFPRRNWRRRPDQDRRNAEDLPDRQGQDRYRVVRRSRRHRGGGESPRGRHQPARHHGLLPRRPHGVALLDAQSQPESRGRVLRQPGRQERCRAAELARACGRGERAGAGPLRRSRHRHPAGPGQADGGRAQGRRQDRGVPRISRRSARFCRRLPAELPQGRGRRWLEADDRLVQEVRRAELDNSSLKQDAALASAAFFMSDPSMPAFICNTCGTQFTPSDKEPARCPICDEERQFVPPSGQGWTTHGALARRYFNCFRQHEPGLIGIGTTPAFAIGQRALLLRTAKGNVLWDCISLLDDATKEIVKGLGGLFGVAISHPHYYSSMVEWAHAFDAPIHLHGADRQWVMRPDPAIQFWDGDTLALADGVTLICAGGHFAGGTVLHWAQGGDGRGALLSGDIVQVIPDRRFVTFMRSYPNMIPLSAPSVERIGALLEPYKYDVIHGAWFDRTIPRGGKDVVRRSVARYIAAVRGDGSAELK